MKAIVWFLAILIGSTSCDESEFDESEIAESEFDESKIGTGPHKKRISSINSSSYGGSYTVTHFQYNGETVSQVRNVYHEPDPNGGYQIVSDVVVKYKYSNGVLTGMSNGTDFEYANGRLTGFPFSQNNILKEMNLRRETYSAYDYTFNDDNYLIKITRSTVNNNVFTEAYSWTIEYEE